MDKITIENLSIQYSDGTELLKNINLAIQGEQDYRVIWTGRGRKIDLATSFEPIKRPGGCSPDDWQSFIGWRRYPYPGTWM